MEVCSDLSFFNKTKWPLPMREMTCNHQLVVCVKLYRFSNYMDKCSGGQTYLTVDKHGKVSLRSLKSLETLAEADWKSYNPPKKLNHREFRFWVSRSTGKCLTVFGGNKKKRTVGVADCKFNGSNRGQLFAFRFHYHQAFCCCGVHNEWSESSEFKGSIVI